MLPYNPRSKNTRYETRETSEQLRFTFASVDDGFAHHGWVYGNLTQGKARGRISDGSARSRTTAPYRESGMSSRDIDSIRKFDAPEYYYSDDPRMGEPSGYQRGVVN